MVRSFYAIDIPKSLKEKIVEIQKELKKYIICKWVEEENLHITLKFLGEIDEYQLRKAINVLNNLELNKFTVEIRGLGAFPSNNNPRVIWLGVRKGKIELENIFKFLDEGTKDIRIEEKNYIPHITLGRVKVIKDREGLKKYFNKNSNILIGEFKVDEIKLKKSTLTPNGPIYEDIFIKRLL